MTPTQAHPKPPASLGRVAARAWRSIVREFAPTHFSAANLLLLEQLCRLHEHVVDCDVGIRRHGLLVDGKSNPLVTMRNTALANFRAIATKLRLPLQSTEAHDSKAVRPDERHGLPKPWDPPA